jgi:hypothetical protein
MIGRVLYLFRGVWRFIRVSKTLTLLLGPQYRRSRDRIEIDITYSCNLRCFNCNRSVRQAPERLHMQVSQVQAFVSESIARGKRWTRIRVLGGEPTLHPQFFEIVAELRRYREWHSKCLVEIVTNGHGAVVEDRLNQLPIDIWVENSRKKSDVQPAFRPFNLAPIDDWKYLRADYRNGCAIARDCGMGLTPLGYYPCAVAGGIDRIGGAGLGRANLPDDTDDMSAALDRLCRLCGRFKDGHWVPQNLRRPLTKELMSASWTHLYERWRKSRSAAPPSLVPLRTGKQPRQTPGSADQAEPRHDSNDAS